MKKVRILWVLGLLWIAAAGMAQHTTENVSFRIKGVLLDSLTHEGEPYATIKIAREETPDKAVKMLVTDMKGAFRETVKGKGRFRLTITSVGRQAIVRCFEVCTADELVDFGTLYMSDAGTELGQVEVVAQKPLVKADIDKIEYNVQDDPDSKSNSVLEMLRKVPLVTVDGEDNIKVNGSSSFKVFVNGKPNNLMSNNPTDVLKSMPANSIKHIEVITNPGPKYDAEGVGGILNIVTVGSGMEGYTVTVSGGASSTGGNGGLFGTVQHDKLTVSARYNYNLNNAPRTRMGGSRTTLGEPSAASSDLTYTGDYKRRYDSHSGSLEASYEIDTLRLLSASFSLFGSKTRTRMSNDYLATSPLTGGMLYGYTTSSRSRGSSFYIDGGVDYQRSFPTVKGRLLTFSYKINTTPNTSDNYQYYDDMQCDPEWQSFIDRLNEQHDDADRATTEHTFQLDYTTPIGNLHTVESGVKYILRNNTAEDNRYDRPLASTDDYTLNSDYTSHYQHRNDILAAYAGYGLKWKKLSGRLGVRYEHTIQDVDYKVGRGDDFRKHFDDVVPSASLGWKLTDMSNLRLGYNLRIYRPSISYLNPYLNDRIPSSLSQGNPNLKSEKSHRLSLSYSNFTQKFNINLSMSYSFTNNSIEGVSMLLLDTEIPGVVNPSGKEVNYTTYANIGKTRFANLSGYVNWNATKNTRVYMNIYGGYSDYDGGNGLKNSGWNMFCYGGLQHTLPKEWRISLNGNWQTPWISLQGKGASYFDYGMSVNKSFLKKRLTLSAYCANIFHIHKRYASSTETETFRSEAWNRMRSLRYGMSISYRFGELKASVKKASRTISNDDVKSEK